jgi:hypothetical protein
VTGVEELAAAFKLRGHSAGDARVVPSGAHDSNAMNAQ